MLPTDLGRTWFARWQSTTPSVSADARSFGNDIFSRLSIIWRNCSINSVSSFWRSNSRRIVKLSFSAGMSRFQDTFLCKKTANHCRVSRITRARVSSCLPRYFRSSLCVRDRFRCAERRRSIRAAQRLARTGGLHINSVLLFGFGFAAVRLIRFDRRTVPRWDDFLHGLFGPNR